jgi:hypothetical protein
MRRAAIVGGAIVMVLAIAFGFRTFKQHRGQVSPASAIAAAPTPSPAAEPEVVHPDFLYGRITASDGSTYEGRLRWGDGEEAFWSDYFNGAKTQNRWAIEVPRGRLPWVRHEIRLFRFKLGEKRLPLDTHRLFMARFGDISRIEPHEGDVRVTLKSGSVFDLDRYGASDFDDGVRVWDAARGVVDLTPRQIRAIELLPTARLADAPERLHGTVHTRQGDFTGFVQWHWQKGLGTDEIDCKSGDRVQSVRLDTIRSIERRSPDSAVATLIDGGELALAERYNRGTYVDDPRYGRVLISWDVFQRLDLTPGGSGAAYGDFPAGSPLSGSVKTRDGSVLSGRLVFDLDESETTETLDAPFEGVGYTIAFGLVASIVTSGSELPLATVTLRSGEQLQLERDGDLGERNGGMLIFVEGRAHPDYVPWSDVEQVDFD